jgi:hypothetical protein
VDAWQEFQSYRDKQKTFDLAEFMKRWYPGCRPRPYRDGLKWSLPCPWTAEHKHQDDRDQASVIQWPDGGITYKCFHSSCRRRGWHTFATLHGEVRDRKAEYQEYLLSPEWAAKREQVHRRSGGRCEWVEGPGGERVVRCPLPGREVHHDRYPVVWGSEPIEWLRHLCEGHHDQAHGRGTHVPQFEMAKSIHWRPDWDED